MAEEDPVADEDVAIVEAVRSGDAEAFRVLVERHKHRLYAVILRLVGDPCQAEELAQETFVRAFRALKGFRGESSFGTWLTQIGIHVARDRMRSARRRSIVSIDAPQETHRPSLELVDTSPASDPGFEVEAEEERRLMRIALASLPPEYREVLVLKHFEDWAYGEIAAVTGATVGTLKVRAYRARHLLRERLTELGWDPDAGGDSAPVTGESSSGS
jgi:RNA polymerase sigma-70 factor (ECF subfamily)